jgi:hypothetical protein
MNACDRGLPAKVSQDLVYTGNLLSSGVELWRPPCWPHAYEDAAATDDEDTIISTRMEQLWRF